MVTQKSGQMVLFLTTSCVHNQHLFREFKPKIGGQEFRNSGYSLKLIIFLMYHEQKVNKF